jgi:hypothetical protein
MHGRFKGKVSIKDLDDFVAENKEAWDGRLIRGLK